MNYRNTYHILLMGGMAPIPMEVCADTITLNGGVYSFIIAKKVIAYYPVNLTVIKEVEVNPDYVAPPRPERDVRARVMEMRHRNLFDRD